MPPDPGLPGDVADEVGRNLLRGGGLAAQWVMPRNAVWIIWDPLPPRVRIGSVVACVVSTRIVHPESLVAPRRALPEMVTE
jgi:hypothetical protein